MTPATKPKERREDVGLLAVDPASGRVEVGRFAGLPGLLEAGDLLVLNDAATLPASLPMKVGHIEGELRLAGAPEGDVWLAVAFGPGSWRERTEDRAPPPALPVGTQLEIGPSLQARVIEVSPISPRLVRIQFDRSGTDLFDALYAVGRPIQYSHLEHDLELWSVQTVFAGRPWAVEMPSAGRPLTWSTLAALRAQGVGTAFLTHAAGLSATGDPTLDAALPLPERYDIPSETVAAVARTRARGGRVIAVGTTVVRALEGAQVSSGTGTLSPGEGVTDLVIDASFQPKIVDGIVTGLHAPTESHFRLLSAFASPQLLREANNRAIAAGHRTHEFGDASLVLPGISAVRVAA